MKSTLVFLTLIFASFVALAQTKFPPIDKSPLDISYYPENFPLRKLQGKANEPLVARVVYSRPQKNGRVVFGELIEYNKVWRLGANEATELEFFQNVRIGSAKIKKGRYTLYCIPNAEKWTFILNRETDTWGSFMYDQKKDLVRQEVTVQKQAEPTESFSFVFEKLSSGFALTASWDSVKISLPIYLQ